ncbi:histidine phosphatase family protein [Burkholderia sp. MR1-5-21]
MHLRLVAHAATRAMRTGAFPDDDPLDARGVAQAADARAQWSWPPDATVLCSPARCARQTAEALELHASVEPALAEIDYGRWRGKRLADVVRETPERLHAWLADPSASPHGGESFDALRRRVGAWLDRLPTSGDVIAIASAPVIRAAIAHASGAASATVWRADIAPLSIVELSQHAQEWIVISGFLHGANDR